jgi:hypothetical protein
MKFTYLWVASSDLSYWTLAHRAALGPIPKAIDPRANR